MEGSRHLAQGTLAEILGNPITIAERKLKKKTIAKERDEDGQIVVRMIWGFLVWVLQLCWDASRHPTNYCAGKELVRSKRGLN